jgi:hypothetical protein
MIEPVRRAVGPWNVVKISPVQLVGPFNGFAKSVILRINKARDQGSPIMIRVHVRRIFFASTRRRDLSEGEAGEVSCGRLGCSSRTDPVKSLMGPPPRSTVHAQCALRYRARVRVVPIEPKRRADSSYGFICRRHSTVLASGSG